LVSSSHFRLCPFVLACSSKMACEQK
jgi:hypothetical protein